MGRAPQVTVVVLGDLGRSPRMQYHAYALAASGAHVTLIGEAGTALPGWLHRPDIHVVRVPGSRGLSGVPAAAWHLWWAGRRGPRPDVLLVQTPPAIPTLLVSWGLARLAGCRLVFDWHNLGWTLLSHRRGRMDSVARLARAIERACAPLADGHLAVSSALAAALQEETGIAHVSVFQDRPWPARVEAVSTETVDRVRRDVLAAAGVEAGRQPAIVLCPTSWTTDEDLNVLLAAADRLDALWAEAGPTDGVVAVISGEGPGRAAFETRLRARRQGRVHLCTVFVPGDDYPALLRVADIGLSLHVSSSELDVPMKIFDLRAAGVPVCAWDYGPAVRARVRPGIDTRLFNSPESLATVLDALLRGWPEPSAELRTLQAGAAEAARDTDWMTGWDREARAVVLGTPT